MSVNNQKIAVGVDVGSGYTRCVILEVNDGLLRYLGHGEVASSGWTKGRLTDPVAVRDCIQGAIVRAEQVARVGVDAIVLGVGGPSVDGFYNHGRYEFSRPRRVTQDEVAFAVDRATKVRLEDDRMILQMLPQDFTIDGRAGYRHAIGSACTRLEANVYLVTASMHEHDMLIAAAHEAHMAVVETIFEPIAAAYASIVPEERSRGVALLDIGWHSSGFVVYDGDAVVLAKSLPICADHFTRDVAHGLNLGYEDAERLKIEYGCAMLGLTADNSYIEVPSAEGRMPREAPRRQLNDILEARAEDLFYSVREELTRIGMEKNLLEGIVLTGGGAMLTGMWDMAERVLNCPARNGLVTGVENWPDELENTCWTNAGGVAMYAARLKMRRETQRKAPGMIGLVYK